ncbi:MAG: hypothetical protein ABF969_07660 [Sporolactobacillus sp.]
MKRSNQSIINRQLHITLKQNSRSQHAWLISQKSQIGQLMTKLRKNMNTKIEAAFTKTFKVAGVIILISSVFGLFTDQKRSSSSSDEEN